MSGQKVVLKFGEYGQLEIMNEGFAPVGIRSGFIERG